MSLHTPWSFLANYMDSTVSTASSGSTNSSEYLMAACFTHCAITPVLDSISKDNILALRRTLRNLAKVAARASVQLSSVNEFDIEDVQNIYTEVTEAFNQLEDSVLEARDCEDKSPTTLGQRCVDAP